MAIHYNKLLLLFFISFSMLQASEHDDKQSRLLAMVGCCTVGTTAILCAPYSGACQSTLVAGGLVCCVCALCITQQRNHSVINQQPKMKRK